MLFADPGTIALIVAIVLVVSLGGMFVEERLGRHMDRKRGRALLEKSGGVAVFESSGSATCPERLEVGQSRIRIDEVDVSLDAIAWWQVRGWNLPPFKYETWTISTDTEEVAFQLDAFEPAEYRGAKECLFAVLPRDRERRTLDSFLAAG